MTTARPEDGTLQRLLDDEIVPFLEQLRAARYADATVRRKQAIAAEFAQWAQEHLIVANNLNSNNCGRLRRSLARASEDPHGTGTSDRAPFPGTSVY